MSFQLLVVGGDGILTEQAVEFVDCLEHCTCSISCMFDCRRGKSEMGSKVSI